MCSKIINAFFGNCYAFKTIWRQKNHTSGGLNSVDIAQLVPLEEQSTNVKNKQKNLTNSSKEFSKIKHQIPVQIESECRKEDTIKTVAKKNRF